MPTPIMLPRRKSPWETYLPALFLNKIQHKHEMEREELRIKAQEAALKEQREYEETKESKKITRGTSYTGEKGHRRTPVYMGGLYVGEEIGGKIYQKPEQDTTAMARFLRNNPNATPDEIAAFNQKLKGKGLRLQMPDGTIIEVGGGQSSITPTTKTALEKDLIGSTNQLLKLESIGNSVFKEVLTAPGQVKQAYYKFKDWATLPMSEEEKQFLGKARVFIEDLEQYFNTYRKEITGAQAAMKELAMLRKSVLNRKLTPTEFEYSYKRILNKVKRDIRIKRMLKRQGFEGKEFDKRVAEVYAAGADVDDTEIDRRGDELTAQGLQPQQVIQRLKQEGYLAE